MTYDLFQPHRRSIRLGGYNYTEAGVYYAPPVTRHREGLFGEFANGEMQLNEMARGPLALIQRVVK